MEPWSVSDQRPGTHHHLVELYEYLIQGDPPGVFDALHVLLLGAGAREGYHFEGLASTVIVRMITRYIADHRSMMPSSGQHPFRLCVFPLLNRFWRDE